uniref:Uncharacterized protein n=1 Tax=Romanomermis culicivorax TaxID=13658 RepID=A0A915JMQ2_ROMCU
MTQAANKRRLRKQQHRPMDPEIDPRYRCCFNCMRVKTGAIIIGILDILGVLSIRTVNERLVVLMIVLSVVTVGLMFCGILVTNHLLVIPYLVWQVVQMIISMVISTISLISILSGKVSSNRRVQVNGREVDRAEAQQTAQHIESRVVTSFLLWFGFLFAIHLWFFLVIRSLFNYLKVNRNEMLPGIAYNVVSVIPGQATMVLPSPVGALHSGPTITGPAGAITSTSTDPSNTLCLLTLVSSHPGPYRGYTKDTVGKL